MKTAMTRLLALVLALSIPARAVHAQPCPPPAGYAWAVSGYIETLAPSLCRIETPIRRFPTLFDGAFRVEAYPEIGLARCAAVERLKSGKC